MRPVDHHPDDTHTHGFSNDRTKSCGDFVPLVEQGILALLAAFRYLSLSVDPQPFFPGGAELRRRAVHISRGRLQLCDVLGISIDKLRRRADLPPPVSRKGLSCGTARISSGGFSDG